MQSVRNMHVLRLWSCQINNYYMLLPWQKNLTSHKNLTDLGQIHGLEDDSNILKPSLFNEHGPHPRLSLSSLPMVNVNLSELWSIFCSESGFSWTYHNIISLGLFHNIYDASSTRDTFDPQQAQKPTQTKTSLFSFLSSRLSFWCVFS